MYLKSIELKNFRSYGHCKVDLPEGVTLFEGDVGSGKSSVLYAIEFALFGLGDLKSGHLLRNDCQSGFVRLEFESKGKKFEVFRSLEKKGASPRQGNGYLSEEGLKTDLSPEELRKAVLKVLDFKENPSPKSTSWIYRYAVFTPQEEMKLILSLKEEERMQTLRKAFGLEDYKIASENSFLASKSLKEEEKFLQGVVFNLPMLKSRLEEKKNLLLEKSVFLKEKKDLLSSKEAELDALKYALDKARNLLEQKRILSNEIPLLKQNAADLDRQKKQLALEVSELEKAAEPARPFVEKHDEATLKKEHFICLEKSGEKNSLLAALKNEEKNHSVLKQKGVCPTCGQGVFSFSEAKLAELREKIITAEKELTVAKAEEVAAREKVSGAAKAASLIYVFESEKRRFDEGRKKILLNAERLKELEKKLFELELRLKERTELLEKASRECQGFDELTEKELSLREVVNALLQEFSSAKSLFERLAVEEKELSAEIAEKTVKEKRLSSLSEKRTWVEACFQPALVNIEQHVLSKLNSDFSLLFRKWFSLLVESPDLEVEVDESFNPLVEQNGFEQDYLALSGGEKSGLALAYRLALNAVVREATPSLKENLLILDEPTDGFSKEQLSRMRDVLQQIECRQVLLVSHERELEGFVDNVFRVEKKNGASFVTRL